MKNKIMFRDDWNEFYKSNSNSFWKIPSEVIQSVVSNLNTDARILDVGCGSGELVNYFHQIGYFNAEGIDYSEVAIDISSQETQDAKYRCVDIETAQLRNYELIVMIQVFPFLVDKIRTLQKLKNHSQAVILSVPVIEESISKYALFCNWYMERIELEAQISHVFDRVELLFTAAPGKFAINYVYLLR